MNNDNIVKIGTALKWRNTFDITKKYYQENIVTVCGCVFRCKVLQAQGKSPVLFTDKDGHMVYTNTDVWDVVVDMAYYYNFAYDTKQLTKETLEYAKKLDAAIQKQQKEIEAMQADDLKQWESIHAIEKINDEQQRGLNAIHDTFSCFSEGIWIDTLLWSNETLWDNNKYAAIEELTDKLTDLTKEHLNDIVNIREQINRYKTEFDKEKQANQEEHRLVNSQLNSHDTRLSKLESIASEHDSQILDLLNGLNCFGEGQWNNELKWSNTSLWGNSNLMCDTFTDVYLKIEEHRRAIENLNAEIQAVKTSASETLQTINQTFDGFRKEHEEFKKEHETFRGEHNSINNRIERLGAKQEETETLNTEQQRQIDILLLNSSLVATGIWDNNLLWVNESEWNNYKGAGVDVAQQEELDSHDSRLITLEAAVTQLLNLVKTQQTQIEKQQSQLDALMDVFSLTNIGLWQNALLWDNEAKWSDSSIMERIEDGGTGSSNVTVKSYDAETATVTI